MDSLLAIRNPTCLLALKNVDGVFSDTTMTINIGNHVNTYNITKNILNNEISKITNTIYNLFESFYEEILMLNH